MYSDTISDIILQLKENGIAKTHISEFLPAQKMEPWKNVKLFFENMSKNTTVKKRIARVNDASVRWDKKKFYEVGAYEYLGRGLSLEDNVIQFFLASPFVEVATKYYETNDIRIFNILTWIHTHSRSPHRIASQNWHRDQEDSHVLKCFVYLSDITKENGAIQYCKKSFSGGIHDHLRHNMVKKDGKLVLGSPAISTAELPLEDVVTAEGKMGTIFFIDTNGFHRGGFIEPHTKKLRKVMHAVYLKKTAHHIQYGPYFSFNYDKKVNDILYDSLEFKSLSAEAQRMLK